MVVIASLRSIELMTSFVVLIIWTWQQSAVHRLHISQSTLDKFKLVLVISFPGWNILPFPSLSDLGRQTSQTHPCGASKPRFSMRQRVKKMRRSKMLGTAKHGTSISFKHDSLWYTLSRYQWLSWAFPSESTAVTDTVLSSLKSDQRRSRDSVVKCFTLLDSVSGCKCSHDSRLSTQCEHTTHLILYFLRMWWFLFIDVRLLQNIFFADTVVIW